MSTRKLGGGRILGSGRGLAPPVPQNNSARGGAPGLHQRTSSLLSQSESTASLGAASNGSEGSTASPLTTSPLPEAEDLASRVSLENGGLNAATVTNGSKLDCPICNEEMMTLLQLNRHLDDNHQELPEVEQDEVKTWFNKQVAKAKRFQPLAAINQKIKGLDAFESNIIPPTPTIIPGNRIVNPEPKPPDPDEVVDRRHWQRPFYNDACTEPSCGKRLGAVNGSVNCRKCGKLFCEDHTMYQMKLSRSAQHEPIRGLWCRVCETCFKSRDGYNDHNGLIRDDTNDFIAMRRKRVDKQYLEISRLEKRLTKLTQLLASQIEAGSINNGNPLSRVAASAERKQLEQTVVDWEDDNKVLRCPFCQQEFGSWTFRRHHCRICGRVVCADNKTECSMEVGLNVAVNEKSSKEIGVDIRMCRDCKATLFSKRDFALSLSHVPPSLRAYANLLEFETGIRKLLPNFHRLLQALQDPDNPPSSSTIAEASKIRKRLIDSFGKYDLAAKRIRDLPTDGSTTQEKLQKAIYQQASSFLHLHMLSLKSLPRILKHASPHGIQSNGASRSSHLNPQTNHPRSALSSIKSQTDIETSSQMSGTSAAISTMEAEEKELRERLIVLEEQRFMVKEMIEHATKRRKFDEVASLAVNVTDLEKEIDGVNGMLSNLDFEAVYGALV